MPWNETTPVEERAKFVLAARSGLYSMSELCERYEISRPTGYKWVGRFAAEGFEGLHDRSHAPLHPRQRTGDALCQLLLECRRAHPRWGPRKVLDYLRPRHPQLRLPAPSTVGELFLREGLVEPRPAPRRRARGGSPVCAVEEPNELWTADYKGDFRLSDGTRCYPLTVADAATRYLLGCQGLTSTSLPLAREVFERLFREYGLPEAIHTDNGSPFASSGVAGLTRLNVWWIELGITCRRSRPATPQDNPAHERMHRTLAAEVTRPPGEDAAAQQQKHEHFRAEYNQERPHEALGGQTPASRYRLSSRQMPERTPEPSYAGHCEVRRVRPKGTIKFKGQEIFLSEPLAGKHVALEEVEEQVWSIRFHTLELARFHARERRLR